MQEQSLFIEALEQEDPAERAAYLDRACAGDAALRQRIERLLLRHRQAGGPLEDLGPSLTVTLDEPAGEWPGAAVGPYKLLEQIGEGGFGVVFLAEQQQPVRRKVALKVLKPGMDTRQVVARFEAERQALALMDHPNIAKVLDGGETTSARPYFVMELVRGTRITDFCDQNCLSVRDRLGLFVSVCRAVQHAHQKGIIHRDLKPSNVLVSRHDTTPVVKVIDFGVAKALGQELTDKTLFTGVAQMVGTPLYMSPEQAGMSDLDVDTRSDIYSLGVLLYELLTGTTPFDKERFKQSSYDEIRRIIREEEPVKPSTRLNTLGPAAAAVSANRESDPRALSRLFRAELDWVVMKALEKDRSRRYETAAGLAADVQRYLADEPVLACPPSAGYRFRKFARRHQRAVLTTAAAALGLVLAVAVLATSTVLIARALKAETDMKGELADTLKREEREAYFHRITLAHGALLADNLPRALQLLGECLEELRGWEWHYLMRLCKVEPVVFPDTTEVHGLAFSPDGGQLASGGGDGLAKLWNTTTGRVVRRFPAHAGYVSSVAFHPGGRHLATVGSDRKAKVWDLAVDPPALVFDAPCDVPHVNGTAYAVAFRPPDGRQLAAGSGESVTVWDWVDRRPLRACGGHEPRAISVAFSRDGRLLATGTWKGVVRLWDAEAGGDPLCVFPESLGAHHPTAAVEFSPDGGRLATANYGRRVDVWDTAAGRRLHVLRHPGLALCVAFGPDGRRIASGGEDKTVRLWDSETGREVLALRGHTGNCSCVAFSPDGRRLASASQDQTIRLWDATPLRGDERQEARTVTHHRDEVWSLALSPDRETVASAGFGPVVIWNARTERVIATFGAPETVVFRVAWAPDGRRVATAGLVRGRFAAHVWDAQTGREEVAVRDRPGDAELFGVAFSRDGEHLVTGRLDGAVQVWDARTGAEVGTLGTHDWRPVRVVVFSPDGRHLATASTDGAIKLWDGTRLRQKQQLRLPPLRGRVHGTGVNLAFSPDGRQLASGGEENTVKVWDVETGKLLRTLRGHSGDVYTVAFSPDGRWLASAGEDSAVRVWDARAPEARGPIRSFRGHTALVTTVAFSPDGKWLFSGSRDHTVKVWDVAQLDDGPTH